MRQLWGKNQSYKNIITTMWTYCRDSSPANELADSFVRELYYPSMFLAMLAGSSPASSSPTRPGSSPYIIKLLNSELRILFNIPCLENLTMEQTKWCPWHKLVFYRCENYSCTTLHLSEMIQNKDKNTWQKISIYSVSVKLEFCFSALHIL